MAERITESNYVDEAEKHIKNLVSNNTELDKRTGKPRVNDKKIVTTSKLRGLLAMVSDIYNDVLHEPQEILSNDLIARINYLKVHFYYEAGREETVKELLKEAKVFEVISDIKGKRSGFILFSRYMEALVAFRKFYVEKDD